VPMNARRFIIRWPNPRGPAAGARGRGPRIALRRIEWMSGTDKPTLRRWPPRVKQRGCHRSRAQ